MRKNLLLQRRWLTRNVVHRPCDLELLKNHRCAAAQTSSASAAPAPAARISPCGNSAGGARRAFVKPPNSPPKMPTARLLLGETNPEPSRMSRLPTNPANTPTQSEL